MPHKTPNNPFYAKPETYARLNANEAAMTSRKIDAWLVEEGQALERRRKAIKLLLLGQSQSGKSTFLRMLQLVASRQCEAERPAWKIVIQLEVIGSVKTILDTLEEECDPDSFLDNLKHCSLHELRRKLSRLFVVESKLLNILAPGCTKCGGRLVGVAWKALLQEMASSFGQDAGGHRDAEQTLRSAYMQYDPSPILVAEKDDIIAIWRSPQVQSILKKHRTCLEDSSGFFMDNIERITSLKYVPTDSDIMKVQICTHGIQELELDGRELGLGSDHIYITTVRGTRQQRAMWIPYFEDVQFILFLAPLAFNEVLEEDITVNRLEDSFTLWRQICSNKLLAEASILLVFNKIDILERILAAGVQVRDYVCSFGERTNNLSTVVQYFRDHFVFLHKTHSPTSRPLMIHVTSGIDMRVLQCLLECIRTGILRQHLAATAVI